jgi:hypothetical protein
MLLFLYDIPINKKKWAAHVDKALHVLKDHLLFLKKFKFSLSAYEYLGHIVNHNGVWVDPKKIKAM